MTTNEGARPEGACVNYENGHEERRLQDAVGRTRESNRATRQAAVADDAVLLTVKQVAAMMGISTKTVRRLVASGQLPGPVKIGTASRFVAEEVRDLIDHLKAGRRATHVRKEGWE